MSSNLFRNRIVGYTTKRASQLTANPLNWRVHPQRQRDAVQASLRELGWVAAVVENVESGLLIDGHERVWQALENDEEVPVLQVRLNEEEERKALLLLDPITALAETDGAVLDELLSQVETMEPALQSLLDDLASEIEENTLVVEGSGEHGDQFSDAPQFSETGWVVKIPISDDLVNDPDFKAALSDLCHVHGLTYKIGRS